MTTAIFARVFLLCLIFSTLIFSKTLHFFSPWDYTAPKIVVDGQQRSMIADYDNCGWYTYSGWASDFDNFYITNKLDSTYGEQGRGSTDPIKDIDPVMQGSEDAYLYFKTNQSYSATASRPKTYIDGSCLFGKLKGEFFDWNEHDFDLAFQDYSNPTSSAAGKCGNNGQHTKGLVKENLDSEGLPVANLSSSNTTGCKSATVNDWFKPLSDSSNYICKDLDMRMNNDGIFEYEAFTQFTDQWGNHVDYHTMYIDKASGFFPLDDFTKTPSGLTNKNNQMGVPYDSRWDDAYAENESRNLPSDQRGYQHNYHFCMKTHTTFTYHPGQHFTFNGDDDLWIFVDNTLALDIGGVHLPNNETLNMDEFLETQGGAEPGSSHDFDLFYCERETLASNLKIQTDIDFEITPTYKHITENGKDYYIQSGADFSNGCQASRTDISRTSDFFLSYDDKLNTDDDEQLNPNKSYYGGLTIDANQYEFHIDRALLTDLEEGHTYYLFYRSESHNKVEDGHTGWVSFTVPQALPYSIVFVDAAGNPLLTDAFTLPVNQEHQFYVTIVDYDIDSNEIPCDECGDHFELTVAPSYDDRIRDFKETYDNGLFSFVVAAENGVIDIDSIRIEVTYTGEGTRINELQTQNSPKVIFERIITPYIMAAEIYDNGTYYENHKESDTADGIADSLVIYTGNWEGEPEELTLCIGKNEMECQTSTFDRNDWTVVDSTLIITQNFEYDNAGAFTDIGGTAELFFYEKNGERIESKKILDDKIGPIIILIQIKKDLDNKEDLLRVTFSEKVKNIKAEDYVFLVNDTPIQVTSAITRGESDVWDFTIEADGEITINVGDIVSLNPTSGLTDAYTNPPGNPNRGKPVYIISNDMIPTDKGNYFLDFDSDGTMDRILLTFQIPVTAEGLKGLLTEFSWISSTDENILLHPKGNEWVPVKNNSFQAYWNVPQSIALLPNTTSLTLKAHESAKVTYTPTEGGDAITYTISMEDGMAPVLVEAFLYRGIEYDSVIVFLSEEIQTQNMIHNGMENYSYNHRSGDASGTIVTAYSSHYTFHNTQTENNLTYNLDSKKEYQIAPGDTIRMVPGSDRIKDLSGNSPGNSSKGIPIIGRSSPSTHTVSIKSFDNPDEILEAFHERGSSPMVHSSFSPDLIYSDKSITEQASEEFNQVGFVQSGNMLDLLLSEIPKTVLDTIPATDLKLYLKFQYTLTIYNSHGAFVAKSSGTIECSDEELFYEGDCTLPENERWLWIGWDPISNNGRLVGTGVYIAIFEHQYLYPSGTTQQKSLLEKVAYIRDN